MTKNLNLTRILGGIWREASKLHVIFMMNQIIDLQILKIIVNDS